jgi:TonB family C-terminal domain
MDSRKAPKADLERERSIYFLYGLVVILSVFFVVLEWQSEDDLSTDWAGFSTVYIEEELIGFEEIAEEAESIKTSQTEEMTVSEEEMPTSTENFEVVDKPVLSIEINMSDSLFLTAKELEDELMPQLSEQEIEDIVHARSEIMPEYPGGYEALVRFLFKHTEYPSVAKKQKIEGRVWCAFIINKDGSVTDIKIEKGIYSFLDDEALRVLRLMPLWTPGRIDNQPVRVRVYLPIVFKL